MSKFFLQVFFFNGKIFLAGGFSIAADFQSRKFRAPRAAHQLTAGKGNLSESVTEKKTADFSARMKRHWVRAYQTSSNVCA